jgi:probable F420-dependent oxidoreductase
MTTGPLMVGVSLGGSVPQGVPSRGSLLAAARQAEASGYDALWCGDHVMMYSPILEPVTLLSAFAAVTERVKLGTAVYLLPLRHPVVTAKLFAGLDHVSGGRLIFGVGVGGEFAKEFEACGVPPGERGSRTDEGLEIIRRLWSETRVTHEGRHHRFRDVTLEPPPVQRPHPPIWVGGRSAAALRRAARAADGWLAYMATPRRIRESMARIRDEAARQGRDPAGIAAGLLLFLHIAGDRQTARRRVVEDLSARYHQPFEGLVDGYCAFGSPADCAAAIGGFLEAGVRNLVLKFTCAPAEQGDQQAAFAEGVLPLIRSA